MLDSGLVQRWAVSAGMVRKQSQWNIMIIEGIYYFYQGYEAPCVCKVLFAVSRALVLCLALRHSTSVCWVNLCVSFVTNI